MRIGLDARADAQDDPLLDAVGHRLLGDAVELLVGVDDEARNARLDALVDLALGLVVALREDAVHREARCLRERQLAAARDVDADALFGDDLVGGDRAERLRRVDDGALRVADLELVHVGAQLAADVVLVVHVQGRAVLARDVKQVDPADRDLVALDLHGRGGDFEQLVRGQVIWLQMRAFGCDGHVTFLTLETTFSPVRSRRAGRARF